jgi:hypothetical protein
MNRYPDPRRSKIILIGASDYEHDDKITPLPAIRNNLVGLEEALTNPSTGVFTSENCTVADSPDSPRSMLQRLRRSAREAEDVLVAYYAGHGLLGWAGKLYLPVRETDPDQLDGTAVPFESVRDAIRESPADIRLLILDCCFSGRAIGAMSSDSAALEQIKIAGTTILTSTTANDISQAIPGERYTAFTGELIKVLTGPHYGVLTIGDLYPPLSAAMARRRLPSPKNIVGDSSGSIIIRRPTTPQHAPKNFINGPGWVAGPVPRSQAPSYSRAQMNLPGHEDRSQPPTPTQPYGPSRAPQSGCDQHAVFLKPSASPTNPHGQRPLFASQTATLMKRVALPSAIIVSAFSIILSGGVLAAGITQTVQGQNTDGVAATVFTIIFISAWLAGSIFWLILAIKRAIRRRHSKQSLTDSHALHNKRMAAS